jgi:hypothetical protein
VLSKKCDLELKTECKARILLETLQTWFRDLVQYFQVLVIAFQVPILVSKHLGKTVIWTVIVANTIILDVAVGLVSMLANHHNGHVFSIIFM